MQITRSTTNAQRRMHPAHRRRLSCCCSAVLAVTLSGCAAAPPLPTPPKVTARAPPTGGTPPRIDPSHPLRIGEEYYPPESRRLQEEGLCVVRIEVDPDGHIRATQLLSSSGFERLNAACLAGFAGGRLLAIPLAGNSSSVRILSSGGCPYNGFGLIIRGRTKVRWVEPAPIPFTGLISDVVWGLGIERRRNHR